MKKVINKFKKVFLFIGTFLFSLYSKVSYSIDPTEIVELYGVPEATNNVPMFVKILKGILIPILIPITFIIGTIIYFKKSSSSNVRKVITILIAAILVVAIYFGVNYMLNN